MKTFMPSRRAFSARLLQVGTAAAAALLAGVPQPSLAHPPASVQKHERAVNAVVHWNSVADQALTPGQGTNLMALSRILAILHASIHDTLGAFRIPFKAGELILSGSLAPLVPAQAGDRFTMAIEGLGECSIAFTE